MTKNNSAEPWLRLQAASKRLGVSPRTLRRWADEGRIPCRRTAGGQRTFAAADVERLQNSSPTDRTSRVPDTVLQQVRSRLSSSSQTSRLSPAMQEVQRLAGRQLLALAVQYVARRQNCEAVLQQARRSGYETGHRLAAAGCTAIQAAERFYFFVDRIESVILGDIAVGNMDADQQRAQQRLKTFFREVLFGVMEGIDEGRGQPVDRETSKRVNR